MPAMKHLFFLSAVILLTFFSYRSLLFRGYFPMHDDLQAMRLLQLDKCVKDGQIPCRWVPDMGYGYGYPQFNFYAPLPYYVMEIFHLSGFGFLDSVKAGFITSFVAAALAMYLLARTFWGPLGGVVSALFYTFGTYRAAEVYSRGAAGEGWSFIFFPLIIYCAYRLIITGRLLFVSLLALSYGGLLLTHNLMSLVFSPIVLLFCLFVVAIHNRWRVIPKLALASLWGASLAAFFVLPALFETSYAHVETLRVGYFNFLAHFVSLKQMFTATHWGYGSSELGPYDDASFSLGLLHWLLTVVVLAAAPFFYKAHPRKVAVIWFMAGVGIVSAFLAHQRSSFIWESLPFLSFLQFPWRFLTIMTFCFSLLPGALFLFVRDRLPRMWLATALIVLLIFMDGFSFRPRLFYDITDQDKFSGALWEKELTISIFDYLPIFAKMPPGAKAPDLPQILAGEGQVVEFHKGTDHQEMKITVKQAATVQLSLFDFPGWQVSSNDQLVVHRHDNDLGLITFDLKPGQYQLRARLTNTPVRTIRNILSLVAVTLFVIVFIFNKRRVVKFS